MASILKRKGGPMEVVDSPKRVKSIKEARSSTPKVQPTEVGWDAAFKSIKKPQELVTANGTSEHISESDGEAGSQEAEEFETFLTQEARNAERAKRRKHVGERSGQHAYRITEPIGGRMINVDPIFTVDEKYLIVATRVSIHVYSTTDSLLTRSIRLQIDFAARPSARIITYCLSPTSPNLVWVACSDGGIYCIDWTTGAGADQYWGISSTGCIHMTVASMESAGRRRDVVFTTELRKDNNGWRITANELAPPNGPIATVARTIYTSTQHINFLKTAKEGSVIVAASEKRVLLGSLRSTEYDTVDKIRYEFRVFESTDLISSLDLRVSSRKAIGEQNSKKAVKKVPVVDVVVGDVKGSIFVHNDLLANLIQTQAGNSPGLSLMPRKLHWHRQAVYTVKWSLDGNYIISGGTETVLVLWQLDTGKKQVLPHMSATIQSVVVSPTGSSYGVQLADNSTMVLSTTELSPTANIAGIQASALAYEDSIVSRVRRVEDETWNVPLVQRTPTVVNPNIRSQLILAVGQVQEIKPYASAVMSTPYLQTFDLASGHNVSRQAATRTNVTNINIAPSAHRVSEPRVTHMQISADGSWLATVDDWLPPKRDLEYLGHQGIDLEAERLSRREIFLKFWQWNSKESRWELVSRIDNPHSSGHDIGVAGKILDLASDPSTLRFSTIGEDGTIRTWSTRVRKRDGVVVKLNDGEALRNWTCEHAISLGKPELEEDSPGASTPTAPRNGCLAFSDDGSTLAAAYGSDGLIHLLDTESGSIRLSRGDMFAGEIIKLAILGQNIVSLSDRLLVYDLVADELKFGFDLAESVTSLSTEQRLEMIHLAIDRKRQTFAIALPGRTDGPVIEDLRKRSLLSQFSELAVFSPTYGKPLSKDTLSTLVTALVPALGSEGYFILDTAAEIRTMLQRGVLPITALAKPTSDQHLDKEEPTGDLLRLVEDTESIEDIQSLTPMATYQDDDNEAPVVTQQQLSDIFDVAPAFALPPMEDMFYQVAGLFSSKPISQGA